MRPALRLFFVSLVIISCSSKKKADLLIYNAIIYTVDSSFSVVEAMAIKDGKIIATGKTAELQKEFEAKEMTDAGGKFIYPGFIDAHSHFLEYCKGLQIVNLVGSESWEDVLKRTAAFAEAHGKAPGKWIQGRGWDQNDWDNKTYPDNSRLNEMFPDQPVFLERVDGHAAIVNQKAMDMFGIKAGDTLTGGEIEVVNGKLTGLLIDNAKDLVFNRIPDPTIDELEKALKAGQANCFAAGLTTVADCGIDFYEAEQIKTLQQEGKLQMRVYAMLSDNQKNFDWLSKNGVVKTDALNVRSIKVYADGALGSRGACLLKPYHDKPGWSGFLLSNKDHFDSVASLVYKQGWQLCTHAIGDSGNRTILSIYAKYLKGKNDLRWRIEHAQVVDPSDIKIFGQYNIIPSVQPTHATSDMYWAAERLGTERIKSAYAYLQLEKENGWLPLGTDFPVEDISPLKTFYAAVVRKDAKGWPANGFQTENALTREDALRGITTWAARANFEEKEKGSLEKGRFADFVILDKDLLKTGEKEILSISIISTYVGGLKLFQKH